MNKILVCPIAFNEYVKLKNVIKRFLKSSIFGQVDYVIIDDGSNDGTSEMIQGFQDLGVRSLRHSRRRGVGAAIRTAVTYGKKNGYDIIVIMAGNDKDNPDEIPLLLEPIIQDGFDFIQGSRYLTPHGIGGDMPVYRKLATRLHPLLFTLVAGNNVTDSTNGFRAFKLSLLDDERIDLDQDWLDHYELEPYIFYKVVKLGKKVKEVPVTKIYPPKELGYTKMKPIVGWWSILKPLFYLGLGIKK